MVIVFSVGCGGGSAVVVVSSSGGGGGLTVVVTFGGRDPSQFILKVTDDVLPKTIIIDYPFVAYSYNYLILFHLLLFLHFNILTGLC